MSYILVTFYVTMAAAGYVIEVLFAALGIIPQNRNVVAITEGMQWNYTCVLNILFLVIAAVLVIRFLRTGGPAMLKMMSTSGQEMDHHGMHHEMSEHAQHEPMDQHKMSLHDLSHEEQGMG
jgi:uncharacterized membrane protein YraQ (UPF0718 family)